MNSEYRVDKPEGYRAVVEDILQYHKAEGVDSLILTLQGDLGAGKTTFTQELGRCLGVTEPITSPTFTIMKQYELDHELFDVLVHIDAYRFESEEEARPLRLEEIVSMQRVLVCVEWPDRIPSYIPPNAIFIGISIVEEDARRVEVNYPNESGRVG